MTKQFAVLVWNLLFVFSGSMAMGVLDSRKICPVSEAEKEKMLLIENPLAKKVFEKYQSINTYHAIWTMSVDIPDPNVKNEPACAIWEVAFDRPTKRILLFIGYQSSDEKEPPQIGQLFIVDGKMMHTALSTGIPDSELQKRSIPVADPNKLTYRDMRQGMFLRPFDLPLLLSELHYMEVIENQIKEIKTLENKESLLGFEVLPQQGETSAVFWVDPKTLLIQKFNFDYHSGKNPVFKAKTVKINQPLDDALFDSEKRLSAPKAAAESQ